MLDQRMEALACAQHGLISNRQASELGCTRAGLRHRLQKGRIFEMANGVYRFPGAPETPAQEAMAAVLTGGEGAALSHNSSAALQGLPGFDLRPLTVSVHRNGRRGRSGIRFEQSLALLAHHRRIVDGVPCTSLARTLFDLCGDPIIRPGRAARALDTALARRLVTTPALWRVLDDLAERGRAGTVLMRALLMERGDRYVPPESELEARFLDLVGRHGLPVPERQVDLGDSDQWIGRVDFLWRSSRVVVEVDGAEFHDGWTDRQHDAERDRRLVASGWTVLRFRWADIVDTPAAVAAAVRNRCRSAS